MKSKKIAFGQFYTPYYIVDFMIKLSSKSKSAKILDTGCGKGAFIEQLLDKGYTNIKCYEIDNENCSIVKSEFGDKVKIECTDYLKSPKEEKFDLIIGNPPYVHWNNIDNEIKQNLKSDNFWKKYSNGKWDLYYAFIIWSVEKLEDDGELIYIVPSNWFNSTYGASLRKYLITNGYFEFICNFGEIKLFDDCSPNNVIFKYRKTKNKEKPLIFVSMLKNKNKNILSHTLDYIKNEFDKTGQHEHESENENLRIFTTTQFESEKSWYLATLAEKKYIDRIEKSTNGITLGDYFNVGVGIVSGYNEAFTISESQLNTFIDNEKKFIFHFTKAKNCKRYYIDNVSYYIFADEIKTEDELKKYPKIYERLLKHKESLTKRYINKNKNWWNWATIRNKKLFQKNLDKPKIFVPCIDRSLNARYSYTEKKLFGSNDVLVIINKNDSLKEDLKYILAWLNSNIINVWYSIKGYHLGHRIKYTQYHVSQIPLRLIDWNNQNEVKIYNEILENVKTIINEKGNKDLEEKINYLFEQLI